MKLWLDVDDLFFFARHSGRPSGIQRLAGETYKAFASVCPETVGFVVHNTAAGSFSVVDWTLVAEVYERLTQRAARDGTIVEAGTPPRLAPLDRVLWVLGLYRTPAPSAHLPAPHSPTGPPLERVASRGDVLCSLGAPWHNADYAAHVAHIRADLGMTFALLVHDLIPLVRPEYFEIGRAPNFEPFMRQTLPLADVILTNSRHTAADVVDWTAGQGITLQSRPIPLPIGTGFTRPAGGKLPPQLEQHEFALYVSTIEVRKNHLQVFNIWSRLLREYPPHRVPKLAFAGSNGWMVADLYKAIENTGHLNGHLVVLNDVDDGDLAALYRSCKFSLFTSHYEGWGLPVSDSLAFGKPCVASNRASIPEAGQSLCAYVDPDNTTHAYEVVRDLIFEPGRLEELEERVTSGFRHVAWERTVQAILQATVQRGTISPRPILLSPAASFSVVADDV
jgi:glycosyltransferase involved in cell wall biosynthesis